MKAPQRRLRVTVRGAVQGVGFRPFVFRLASESGLCGWVNNSSQGVFIEVEGARSALEQFLLRLEVEKPPRSFIQSMEASWLDPVGFSRFEIRASESGGNKTALVLPDIATCPDCLREIFDPENRRYRYPFTNCTNCGPRFSIIESLPYDRSNTSMKTFRMCPECQAEYEDPQDRRFHAQPNACPVCGPQLELWQANADAWPAKSEVIARNGAALVAAANAIREGKILAVKGLGGFHLMADARNDQAVRTLRERKHREEKPFAVMLPSSESVKAICEVSALEQRLLHSPESPIVLLKKIEDRELPIANSVAPGNPKLGVMLPYTPLHHLLMAELNFPVVATSGNLSDEPICTDEHEALERIGSIADIFLVHNRPIARHVDDSIVCVMLGREMVLRRARGYAPLPILIGEASYASPKRKGRSDSGPVNLLPPITILAVGAHLKNSVALSVGHQVFISQHIGDLETELAHSAFRDVIADFERLYEATPEMVAADLHPDYLSTKYAGELGGQPSLTAGSEIPGRATSANPQAGGPRHVAVQHHIAHVLSCMAENEVAPPALGVSWDGTGLGLDGTIWGGEFFMVTRDEAERVAHLRPFRLPGGELAVKEPRRVALALLHEMFGEIAFERNDIASIAAFSRAELNVVRTMLAKNLNSPATTSMGRLFDAVASIIGLRQTMRFEGQAAMELEFALGGIETDEAYPMPIADSQIHAKGCEHVRPINTPHRVFVVDWSGMIEAILADVKAGVGAGMISAKFHNTLAEVIVSVARRMKQDRVVLSGGCFQNRYVTERTVRRLEATGFRPYWHQRVPPNDGGISLGQVVAALRFGC